MTTRNPAERYETTLNAFLDLQYNTNKVQTLLKAAIDNPLFARESDDDLSNVDNLLEISIDYMSRIKSDGENCEAGFMRLLTEKRNEAAPPAKDNVVVHPSTQPASSLPIGLVVDLLACALDPARDKEWLKKAAALSDRIVRETKIGQSGEPLMTWLRLIHARGMDVYADTDNDGIVRFQLSPTSTCRSQKRKSA